METRKTRPENDNQPEKSSEDTTGIGRSYDCTFCKRGFTNAQALGGHMNIHRKDKAKAKQKNQDEPSSKLNENYANLRYFPQISSTYLHHHHQQQQQQSGCYRAVARQVNYQNFLPSSNPNFQPANYSPIRRQEEFDGNVDANLSLRIGISPPVEGGEEGNEKENEVDLELRLGHDP